MEGKARPAIMDLMLAGKAIILIPAVECRPVFCYDKNMIDMVGNEVCHGILHQSGK